VNVKKEEIGGLIVALDVYQLIFVFDVGAFTHLIL